MRYFGQQSRYQTGGDIAGTYDELTKMGQAITGVNSIEAVEKNLNMLNMILLDCSPKLDVMREM